MLIPERLTQLQTAAMGEGYRRQFDENANPIEWAAYLVGERHSSAPDSVCPIIAAVVRKWNAKLKPEDRTRLLKDFVPRLTGTKCTDAVTIRRGWMVLDWQVHVWLASWVNASDRYNVSPILTSLPRITDMETVRFVNTALAEAYVPIQKSWAYEICTGEQFEAVEKVLHRSMQWTGSHISEYLFEKVMLGWPESSAFGLEGGGTGTSGWWPPLICLTSNLGWYSAQSLVWPSLKKSQNPDSEAEHIFAPLVEEQYQGLRNLIERLLVIHSASQGD